MFAIRALISATSLSASSLRFSSVAPAQRTQVRGVWAKASRKGSSEAAFAGPAEAVQTIPMDSSSTLVFHGKQRQSQVGGKTKYKKNIKKILMKMKRIGILW
jgi:hypothetical protein